MTNRTLALLSPNRPWLHLVYLGFFFFGWLYTAPTPTQAALSLAAMALFIAAYVFTLRRGDWTVYLAALGAVALSFALLPVNMGGAVYLVFAAAMLGWLPGTRLRNAGLGLLVLPLAIAVWQFALPLYAAIAVGLLGMLAAGGAMMGARRQSQDATAQERQVRAAANAAEAERQRIARDLHDLLGHTLSVVALKADLATRLFDADPDRARGELAEIQSISRQALAEVREAVTGLRERGLAAAADEACQRLQAAGLKVSTDLDAEGLPAAQATALAMVVREAATNILRHAEAGQASIALTRTDHGVELRIGDDGRGGARIGAGGLGGLAARLLALSGELIVQDGPGARGCVVIARLPTRGATDA
tara:strand:- start:2173 stop:3261 length:1089 start_codon:yes stop_codon:yes gene_type:complete